MRYGIRIIAALGLVALLVPVAAVAKDARVKGPSALVGAGYYGGELELAMEEGQRPVKLAARAGYIGVLDLDGDLKIRCVGTGRLQKQETANGIVYRCAGRKGGEVVLLGSHFTFRGFASHYTAMLPAGARGTWHGRFVVRGERGDAQEGRRLPSGHRSLHVRTTRFRRSTSWRACSRAWTARRAPLRAGAAVPRRTGRGTTLRADGGWCRCRTSG